MTLKKNLHWIIYSIFLLIACARQSAPTGGPKDSIPPVLVNANPANEEVNFKGKRLEITFNEMIEANNPNEQLIVTPSIGKKFNVKTKRNTLILDFEKPLEENTTYTFNFRETVVDVTEKNPVKNFQLAVSTGDYIDSLSIEGTIFNLQTGKEIKDATVALHTLNDTFNILKHPATIFTRTNEKGKFKIDHLKPGLYYIYAMEDRNKNLVVDSRTEAYGFKTDPILLKTDTSKLQLGLIKLDARPLKLTSARPFNTFFNIRTSKNITTFNLTATDSSMLYYSFGEDQSNIRIYNTFQNKDSLAIHFTAIDSIDNKIDTTLYAKFLDREVTPEKFNTSIKSTSIIADKGQFKAIFSFSKPVKTYNFDSLYFEVDSLNQITFTLQDITWDNQHNTATISKTVDKKLFAPKIQPERSPQSKPSTAAPSQVPTLAKSNATQPPGPAPKPQVSNQLFAGKGAFISIENDSSKKLTETITPLKIENLSMIIFDIRTVYKNILVQLVDKDAKVIKQINGKIKGQFEDLVAGEYMVRVVIDKNNNSKWDPGNYLTKQEPEPIIYYLGEKGAMTINLKSNWEFQMAPMLINF